MPEHSSSSVEQTADILAHAAAEAATPGADTESAYECPFCVMMRKGGCEDPFKVRIAAVQQVSRPGCPGWLCQQRHLVAAAEMRSRGN